MLRDWGFVDPAFIGLLRKYRVALVVADTAGKWPLAEDVTSDFVYVRLHGDKEIYVSGYTDTASIGPALRREGVASNEVLSQRRAEDVKDFLASQGFRPELLVAQGYGEGHPIASNDTPKGRAQNRRVELSLAPPA